MRKKFAVFVSGYGRGAIEIIKDYRNGLIKPQLSLLLSSNPESGSLNFAQSNDIPCAIIEKSKFETKLEFENEINLVLSQHEIDYIFLAGWMPIVGSTLLKKHSNKIINIHPSLLPSFKGLDALDQALDYGVKITGITTHFVDKSIDGGGIILQKHVYVDEEDDFQSLDKNMKQFHLKIAHINTAMINLNLAFKI